VGEEKGGEKDRMKLPRYTARVPPPRGADIVRAADIGSLTRTGEVSKWRGIGTAGGFLGRLSDRLLKVHQSRRALDSSIEVGEAGRRAEERFDQAFDAANRTNVTMDMPLPDDPDYLKTLSAFSVTKRDKLLAESLAGVDKDIEEILQGFSSSESKAAFTSWYNRNYPNFTERLRGIYGAKLDSYQRAELNKLRLSHTERGNIKDANAFVDIMDKYELITPERAEVLKRQNKEEVYETLKRNYYTTSFQMLLDRGLDATLSHIGKPENVPGLKAEDRHALIRRIKTDHVLGQYEDYALMLKEDAAEVDKASSLYAKGDYRALRDFADAMKGGITKSDWKGILESEAKLTDKQRDTTDWKTYLPLEEEILDYWANPSDESRRELKIKLAQARSSGTLTQRDHNILLTRMDRDVEVHQIGNLRTVFDLIKKRGSVGWIQKPSWYPDWLPYGGLFGEAWRTSASEAKKIADARRGLLSWLSGQKDPSLEEITKQALLFSPVKKYLLPFLTDWEVNTRIG